jgi:hypothetical protein
MSEPPTPADVAAVQARHQQELLRYPNVVGVATGETGLLILVSRKVPASELGPDELLPSEIEGVPVDVVEAGQIRPH